MGITSVPKALLNGPPVARYIPDARQRAQSRYRRDALFMTTSRNCAFGRRRPLITLRAWPSMDPAAGAFNHRGLLKAFWRLRRPGNEEEK